MSKDKKEPYEGAGHDASAPVTMDAAGAAESDFGKDLDMEPEKGDSNKKAPGDVPRYADEIYRKVFPRRALIAHLARIMGEVARLKKTGWNSFHSYHYVTEADVVEAVREKLAAAGIFILSSQEECTPRDVRRMKDGKEVISHGTLVKVKYTFTDGEAEVSVFAYGDSEDTGDKGLYKAVTGAYKYFLLKNFMIPTGDDPEGDSPERHGNRGAKAAAKAPAGKPAQQGQQQAPPQPERETIEAELLDIVESRDEKVRKEGWKGLQIGEDRYLQSKDPVVLLAAKGYVMTGEPLLFEVEHVGGGKPPIALSLTPKFPPA